MLILMKIRWLKWQIEIFKFKQRKRRHQKDGNGSSMYL
jgi:hypothetical protein